MNALLYWRQDCFENIANLHLLWINGDASGRKADVYAQDYSGVFCPEVRLFGANFPRTDFSEANLEKSDLRGINLCRADMIKTNLGGANLVGADLSYSNLEGANLEGANLMGANLSGANLEGATGLPDANQWLNANLEKTPEGWIAYRRQYTAYDPPEDLLVEPEDIMFPLKGTFAHRMLYAFNPPPKRVFEPEKWISVAHLDMDRRERTSFGVGIGTLEWVKSHPADVETEIWKILIPHQSTVVVPYATEGNFRADRVKLLKKKMEEEL